MVYFEDPDVVEPKGTRGETDIEPEVEESHPQEGILLNNPKLKVTEEELKKLRCFYKIPQSVVIHAPKAHERVD